VDNNRGWAEAYKEVAHEDPIQIRGQTQYIDYSFRIGGVRKFIVEAKKPAVNIRNDTESALQLRRYGWNAGLKLSILSDFEEFAVYDCTKKIEKNDTAATARIAYLTFEEYPEKWDRISSIFTGESIRNGSFDKFVESKKGRRGTAGVDDAFLADIEEWRLLLARNIALRNSGLSVEELNVAVQRTLDRIIFLRICEDRGIEKYGMLQELLECDHVYRRLCDLFRHADERYNSGLFYFDAEPGRTEMPDELTPGLTIDDRVLKAIIKRLYYPESPYEFSVIPTDILGHVYEQFLGRVIRLTSGNHAKVEEKPEVRKAGGVFYTPTYIVDYIVHQTVGELLKEKTPKEVSNLTILDPACGSGSFLIGAYQLLLDWHRDWYIANLVPVLKEKGATSPEVRALLPAAAAATVAAPAGKGRKKKNDQAVLPVYRVDSGTVSRVRSDWKLTTAERKRILLNNIYGVDIDRQAVEVTKLSLLLKVLEEESEETVSKQLKLFAERALPSLNENIKCGNSLIGTDIYADVQATLDQTEAMRINAFDWEREFAGVMKAGGFDAVIGNPPWGAIFSSREHDYLKKKYYTTNGRNIDSYSVFIESGLNKLKDRGLISYITPDTFLRKDDHIDTRRFLLENTTILEMIETGPVFSKVRDTWGLVFRFKKGIPSKQSKILHKNISRFIVSAEERLEKFGQSKWDHESEVAQALWESRPYQIFGYLTSEEEQEIIKKMEINPRLKDLKHIYSISRGEEGSKFSLVEEKDSNDFMVIPKDIERYGLDPGIKISKEILSPKKIDKFYSHPKIWIIRIQKMRWKQRIVCTLDTRKCSAGMKTLQMIVSNKDDIQELNYLLGILCSSLMNFYCINYLADDMNKSYLEKFPIRTIDPANPADVARHDRMVALVEQMLALNKHLPEAKTDQEKTTIRRQIEATDAAIDTLVYELYGLSDEEIGIVEHQ